MGNAFFNSMNFDIFGKATISTSIIGNSLHYGTIKIETGKCFIYLFIRQKVTLFETEI